MKYLFLIILISCSSAQQSSTAYSDLKGYSYKSSMVQLDKIKSHKVIIFLSSKCPCSDSHSEHIKELSKKYITFSFIGVHSNFNEQGKEYFQDFPFPVIKDTNGVWARKLGAVKTPHAFILDEDNKIIFQGGITNRSNAKKAKDFFLEQSLNKISNGEQIDKAEIKTLGCFIALKDS